MYILYIEKTDISVHRSNKQIVVKMNKQRFYAVLCALLISNTAFVQSKNEGKLNNFLAKLLK